MSQTAVRNVIQTLEEELQKLLFEVRKKKQAINVLYEHINEKPVYVIEGESEGKQTLRSDQFYGRSFMASALEFLKIKKQACTAEEIFRGLEEGGFDFPWKMDDRLRSVAISLSKNSQSFHKLPNNTFGLLEWYPEIRRKKSESQAKGTKAENASEENAHEESDKKGGVGETTIEDLLKEK